MEDNSKSPDAIDAIIAQILIPLAGLALTYWVGTHAASIEIEVRSRIARFRSAVIAAREGQSAGRKVAEWFIKAEAPKVIAAAESIAASSAEEWSGSGSESTPEE